MEQGVPDVQGFEEEVLLKVFKNKHFEVFEGNINKDKIVFGNEVIKNFEVLLKVEIVYRD